MKKNIRVGDVVVIHGKRPLSYGRLGLVVNVDDPEYAKLKINDSSTISWLEYKKNLEVIDHDPDLLKEPITCPLMGTLTKGGIVIAKIHRSVEADQAERDYSLDNMSSCMAFKEFPGRDFTYAPHTQKPTMPNNPADLRQYEWTYTDKGYFYGIEDDNGRKLLRKMCNHCGHIQKKSVIDITF